MLCHSQVKNCFRLNKKKQKRLTVPITDIPSDKLNIKHFEYHEKI